MITKGDLVSAAIRKLFGDEESTLTGIEPGSMAKALDDMEAMLASWQIDGYDLNYNFLDSRSSTTPLPSQNSDIPLWAKNAVMANLAILIAPDFGVSPSKEVVSEASRGWRLLVRIFKHPLPIAENDRVIPLGTGNLRDGTIIRTGTTAAGDKFK